MRTHLDALFAEHAKPTHVSTQALNDQLGPILKVFALAQKQLVEYKSRLADGELAAHDPLLDTKHEHVHQTLGEIEREVNATVDHARKASRAYAQLDRYMAQTQVDVVNVLEAAAKATS